MKNKNLNILLFALTAVFISACSDSFLDSEPMTTKTDINYYTTPDEASEALVGCYDALQKVWGDGIAMTLASDVMSDLCFAGTGNTDADSWPMMDEFDQSVSPSDLNLFEKNWQFYYQGIYRCNVLINKIDQVDWKGSEGLKSSIEGEARFLRAFFYFDMVRMFERIPLLTEPTEENIPQSLPDETYKLITEDLLFAIDNCTDIKYESIAANNYGHASKWAAESLLARVYLYYTGYYGKSDLVGMVTQAQILGYLEDVITNSGHGLLENFGDLWPASATYEAAKDGKSINANTYAGETNKEVVFAIKYTYTSAYPPSAGEPMNFDGNHWLVMNGLRKQSWANYGYGSGWGACPVLPEVYNTWDPTDSRRDASIMAIEEEQIVYTQIKDVKEYTGYFTKKYTPTCDTTGASIAQGLGGVNFMIGQFQDYFSIRFADVLLMAAELGSSNALDYVNLVHTRAGLDSLSTVDKDIIFEERRLEFAFEGIRYWDLLRYDSTLEYATNKVSYNGIVKTGGVDVPKVINGDNLIKTRGLFQIPRNQITLSNGVLIQNNGWN